MNVSSHTFKANSPPNTNISSKIGDDESLPNCKSEHKSKTDLNDLRSCSSKSSLRWSTNFLTSSFAGGTYLSIIEKLKKKKKNDQAKPLALQAEEHSKRIAKLLEKMVALGRESLLFEVAGPRDKIELEDLES